MCAFSTFIYWNAANVSISDVTLDTGALVSSLGIGTLGIDCAFVCSICTFVNIGVACFTVTIVTGVTDTFKPAGGATILSCFWFACGVNVTVVVSRCTIVRFLACRLAEGVDIGSELENPVGVAFFGNLADHGFQGVSPFACIIVFGVVDQETSNNSRIFGACGFSSPASDFSELGQFGCDCFPSGDCVVVGVGCAVGDSGEFIIGKRGIFGQVAGTGFGIIWMGTFGSVTVLGCILVSVVTFAGVSVECISTGGVFVTIVFTSNTFIIFLLTLSSIRIWIISLSAYAVSIFACF
jgi:hypothetical protein